MAIKPKPLMVLVFSAILFFQIFRFIKHDIQTKCKYSCRKIKWSRTLGTPNNREKYPKQCGIHSS